MSLVSVCSMTLPISMKIHSSLARRAWAMLWVTIRIEYLPRNSQISSSTALDPKGTAAVEELIWELRGKYSILIVTHNMAQARRASEECIFMLMGKVIEHTDTADMFVTPQHQETADYIEGRYG